MRRDEMTPDELRAKILKYAADRDGITPTTIVNSIRLLENLPITQARVSGVAAELAAEGWLVILTTPTGKSRFFLPESPILARITRKAAPPATPAPESPDPPEPAYPGPAFVEAMADLARAIGELAKAITDYSTPRLIPANDMTARCNGNGLTTSYPAFVLDGDDADGGPEAR